MNRRDFLRSFRERRPRLYVKACASRFHVGGMVCIASPDGECGPVMEVKDISPSPLLTVRWIREPNGYDPSPLLDWLYTSTFQHPGRRIFPHFVK